MAFKPIFKFRNPDSTADLNQAYSSAVSKGIYLGGDIIVTPSNLNVSIAPFTVVGHDGLVVVSDSTISLAARSDIGVNVIALFARYERNAEPVIRLEIFEESSIEGSPLQDFYVIFGTIDLSSPPMGGFVGLTYESTVVQPSNIGILTFNGSHYASKVGSSGLKAPVAGSNDLPILKNNDGDLRYAIANKAIFAWDYASKTWINTIAAQAENVSYAGGPAWRDGTTNPAIDVAGDGIAGQVNKMITDLGSGAGTDKLSVAAIGGTPINIPAGTLTQALTNLLVGVNNCGRLSDTNAWAAANLFEDTLEVDGITTLNDQLVITAGGISVTGAATFANSLAVTGAITATGSITAGTSLVATTSASIGTTLTVGGQSTFGNNIGVTGTGTFSGTVSTTEVVTTVAPDNFYVDDALFTVDTLADSAPKGGGIGQYDEKLQDTLERIDTALVRKRAYTAVFTDGTATTGGDHNGANAIEVLANSGTYRAGNFFVRRGLHTFTSAALDNNVTLMGEQAHDHVTAGADQGYLARITYSNGASEFTIGSRNQAASTFTNLAFEGPVGKRFASNPDFSYNSFQHCQFSRGSLKIVRRTILNDVIFTVDTGNTLPESLLIDPAGLPLGIYLRHVRVTNAPTSGIGTKAALRIQNTTDTSPYEPIVIRDSLFANTEGGGYTLEILSSTAPVIFDGCTFYGTNDLIAKINGSKVLFNNCTFIQNSPTGRVLEVVTGSEDIHFTNCKFVGCPTGGGGDPYAADIIVDVGTSGITWTSTFTDCIFEIRQDGVLDSSVYKLTFIGSVSMQNCQVVLGYTSSSVYGPILNFQGHLDGLIFNALEYQYNGNETTPPFYFNNTGTLVPKRPTLTRLFLNNLKAPSVSGVESLIFLSTTHLTQSEISFSDVGGQPFTKGVIDLSLKAQVSDCFFDNEAGAPIFRWIFVGTTANRAMIKDNYFSSYLEESTTSDDGSEIATDVTVFGLLVTGNVFDITANANVDTNEPLIQILSSSESAVITDNYMVADQKIAFVDFDDCKYVTIRDNHLKVNADTAYDIIFGSATLAEGLVEGNQVINYHASNAQLTVNVNDSVIVRDNWGDIYVPKTYLLPLQPLDLSNWSWDITNNNTDGLYGSAGSNSPVILRLDLPDKATLKALRLGITTQTVGADQLYLEVYKAAKVKTALTAAASITTSTQIGTTVASLATLTNVQQVLALGSLTETIDRNSNTYYAYISRPSGGYCGIYWLEVTIS